MKNNGFQLKNLSKLYFDRQFTEQDSWLFRLFKLNNQNLKEVHLFCNSFLEEEGTIYNLKCGLENCLTEKLILNVINSNFTFIAYSSPSVGVDMMRHIFSIIQTNEINVINSVLSKELFVNNIKNFAKDAKHYKNSYPITQLTCKKIVITEGRNVILKPNMVDLLSYFLPNLLCIQLKEGEGTASRENINEEFIIDELKQVWITTKRKFSEFVV